MLCLGITEGACWKQVDTIETAVYRLLFGLGSWKLIGKPALGHQAAGLGNISGYSSWAGCM
jgi:hypothetical protein